MNGTFDDRTPKNMSNSQQISPRNHVIFKKYKKNLNMDYNSMNMSENEKAMNRGILSKY